LPYASIVGAQACAEGVAIHMVSGARLVLATRARSAMGHDYLAGAIIERVNEALRARARQGEAAPEIPLHRDLPPSERLRALRTPSTSAGGYRRGAIPPDRLLRVVEDPAADPIARASAAVALGPALDQEGRARLVRIAEACASPRARIVIEAVA